MRVTAVCRAGEARVQGQNTRMAPCSDLAENSYVTRVCVSGNSSQLGEDTLFDDCTPPAENTFITQTCDPGDGMRLGQNSQSEPCSAIPAGSFVSSACVPGTITSIGSDATFTECSQPEAGHYVIAACAVGSFLEAGRDTLSEPCTQPGPARYVTATCSAGDAFTRGSNTVSVPCSEPPIDTYVVSICTPGNDMSIGQDIGVQPCSTPSEGEFVVEECIAGTSLDVGRNTLIDVCNLIDNCQRVECNDAVDSTCVQCDEGFRISDDGSQCTPGTTSAGPLNWGIEPQYNGVTVFVVDQVNQGVGTLGAYTAFCSAQGMGVPQDNWPSSNCGGGGSYNSNNVGCGLYETARTFYLNTILPNYPNANHDNILIMQGNSPGCWAHNAEAGSMHAFGGPGGSGYAYCRGGESASKRYHVYVCN